MKKLIKKILKESEEDFKWISPKVDLGDTIIYFDKGLTPTQWVKLKNIFRSEGVNYINGDLKIQIFFK